MTWRARGIAIAAAVAAAVYVLLYRLGEGGRGLPAWDIYAHYYPNMLYALRAMQDGGRGILWNPLQNCGQPFLANIEAGLLYPANAFFLVFDPDTALRAVLFVDLLVAGVSAFALCRVLGLGVIASLGGALAFELGNGMMFVTVWAPQGAGPFAWFPAAMLFAELIVQRPTVRRGIGLGVALSLALLPGFPQTVLFIYQMVALRVLWALLTERVERPGALVLVTLLGFALPVLLNALQLLPAIEVVRESVRNTRLSLDETSVLGRLEWADFQKETVWRSALHSPYLLVPLVIAAGGLMSRGRRRVAVFYALTGVLYFVLALGRSTPLYELYVLTPWGGLFREPVRFMWVTSLCVAVLTALALDALRTAREAWWVARWACAVLVSLAALALLDAVPGEPTPIEFWLGGIAVLAFLVAAVWPAQASRLSCVVFAAVVVNLVVVPAFTYIALFRTGDPLRTHADVFEAIRARITPQDRIYVAMRPQKFDLMQKSASVFGLPSIQDYGSQTTARYATLYLRLRLPRRLQSRFDIDFRFFGDALYANANRRLIDLVATRYLVSAAENDGVIAGFTPALPLMRDGAVRVYQNPQALPRAFWVPRVEVVPDPEQVLGSLASGTHDLRQVALVESPLAFTGAPGDGHAGRVAFARNEPEHLVLDVDAPARGFLFLSDQYFPGWRATVDGKPADVVRANYAFRVVEVPQGRSVVEMRYSPPSVWIGAAVSALTLLAVALVLWRTRSRDRRDGVGVRA